MKRHLFVLAAVILTAMPARAAVKTCSAARVSAGDCPSTAYTLLLYPVPTAVLAEMQDEICDRYGYPTITCSAADASAGRCTVGQVGQVVTTTETRNAFASRMVAEILRDFVVKRRTRTAEDAARAGVSQPGPIE